MTVAHYVERWLELSAGFVAAHVQHSRHRGVVVSRNGWLNLDAFPHRPRHSLHRIRDRVPGDRGKARALRAQLVPLLAARRVDLVHVHFGYAASDVLAVTGPRRPFVLSLHGHDVTGLLADDPSRYAEVAARVDAVVVPSRFLAAAAVGAGFDEELISIVPAGVDTEFFTPTPLPAGVLRVGFVGRLVAKKGLDVLLAAWPLVREQLPQARLEVLGDGPMRTLLDATAAGTGVHHVRPDPARRHEQVRDLIRSSTVVVTPSRTGPDGDSESLLLVNLEAAASGRPVVSTTHGGIPEHVDDGRTGLLVPPGDAEQLAAALTRLLRDPVLAAALGAAGREHAVSVDVRRCSARVDDLYDELLSRGR